VKVDVQDRMAGLETGTVEMVVADCGWDIGETLETGPEWGRDVSEVENEVVEVAVGRCDRWGQD
jgi:hypothetical protein